MTIRIDGTNTAANPGITGTDTDTGLQFGTDEVNVVTGGNTRSTVDSSGRLLVGLTTGNNRNLLQIQGDVDNSANGVGGISLRRGVGLGSIGDGSQLGQLDFCMSDGGVAARIICDAEGSAGTGDYPGRLQFETTADGASSPTERLRITSDGTLQLRNSPGIDFSQIQTNLAGMTSETLDSYEEGTWTPSVTPQSGTFTTVGTRGRYTKIGRFVIIAGEIAITTAGTAAGHIEVGNLPFNGAQNDTFVGSVCNRNANAGVGGFAVMQANTGFRIRRYDGATLIANNNFMPFVLTYETFT